MPSSSGGSLVRDTVLGLGPVLLLWGAYLALQLSNEGRARCSPVYFVILAVQARTAAMGPSPRACDSEASYLLWWLVWGAKAGVCMPADQQGPACSRAALPQL